MKKNGKENVVKKKKKGEIGRQSCDIYERRLHRVGKISQVCVFVSRAINNTGRREDEKTGRPGDLETWRQKDRKTERQKDRKTERQKDKKTKRDAKTGREAGRLKERLQAWRLQERKATLKITRKRKNSLTALSGLLLFSSPLLFSSSLHFTSLLSV